MKKTWKAFKAGGREFWQQMDDLVEMLDGVVADEESSVGGNRT
jgi:type I restriction enzyme M protein